MGAASNGETKANAMEHNRATNEISIEHNGPTKETAVPKGFGTASKWAWRATPKWKHIGTQREYAINWQPLF